jgi:hypothetical protein
MCRLALDLLARIVAVRINARPGHADTSMTEKHYALLAPNYVAQTIRQNFSGSWSCELDPSDPANKRRV